MYLIAGLGNPGSNYDRTRHNAGFMALDAYADRLGVRVDKWGFKGRYRQTIVAGEKACLLKPATYMNLSGDSVAEAARYFGIEIGRILVVHDDVDFAPGEFRVRSSGSGGGHNGMKSVIERLGTSEIARIRIGVGKSERVDMVDWVLGRFSSDEERAFHGILDDVCGAVDAFVARGVDAAMNEYNKRNA
jgi:PTH1 family peptidyl-tRNA hydrolase